MTPLLDRLDAYAEIPDMDWNVQRDISEAAAAIREAKEAMGKLRRSDLPDREQPLWDEIQTALAKLGCASC